MSETLVKIGMRLFWNDPDAGLCSAWGSVIETRENMVILQMDAGGIAEVYYEELAEWEE